MGLAVLGAPASKAQSLMAAGGAGGGSEASMSSPAAPPATPAASSPADLDRRIEALEAELSELKTELSAKKTEEAAAPAPAPAPAAQAEKTTIASLLGPTTFSGFVDGYYQLNFNHPNQGAPNHFPGSNFRVFDFNDRAISLNMVELTMDKAPDASGPAGRTGYHVALGFGDAMNVVNSFDPAGSGFAQYLKEAYVSYLAPVGSGLQIDFGKFVTPMGAELIESKDNWNYSRGILFGYAIPFYHFGLRAKYAFNDKYSLTGFLVNGWNNIYENNSGKTYGFAFSGAPSDKVGYAVSYLIGPETSRNSFGPNVAHTLPISVNSAFRQTWDAVLTINPTSKLSLMANFDYGRGDRTVTDFGTTPWTLSDPVYWTGIAAYAKYAINDNNYLAGRYEYYYDHDGFTTGLPAHTHVSEFTATYSRTIASYLMARFEYRHDQASTPAFPLSNFSTPVNYQNTAEIGLILSFDSSNAK